MDNPLISIDVSQEKESAVPKEKFRLISWNMGAGVEFEDVVHTAPPHFHFQVLRPENEKERADAIEYFKAHKKFYAAFANSLTLLLFIGCTADVYIKSSTVQFEGEDLINLLPQAANWLRFHNQEETEYFRRESLF